MDALADMRQLVNGIPLFDGHEHTLPEPARLGERPLDPFAYLLRYVAADMVTAGAAWEEITFIRDTGVPLEKRIPVFARWWKPVRTTGYGWALRILASDLFGIEDLDTDSVPALAERLEESQRPGWYRFIFERARIERAVLDRTSLDGLDSLSSVDRELFAPIVRYDPVIYATSRADLSELERLVHGPIRLLGDLEAALNQLFERHLSEGAVGVKFALAYHRTLEVEFVGRHEAESIFNRIFAGLGEGLSWREAKPLQDYLIHCIIRLAAKYGLPVQIHTGLLYPEVKGHGNRLTNSNPSLLLNLILHYPEVPFVLLHAGIPYVDEFTFLAKSHPNVYADLSWTYILAPGLARRSLHQLIEAVPANKVIAFGGDYLFIEGTYAHAVMAREALARVLDEKISEGYLRPAEAEYLAERYLRANAAGLYGGRARQIVSCSGVTSQPPDRRTE